PSSTPATPGSEPAPRRPPSGCAAPRARKQSTGGRCGVSRRRPCPAATLVRGRARRAPSVELHLDLELQDVVPPERGQSGPPRAFDGDVAGGQEDVAGQPV